MRRRLLGLALAAWLAAAVPACASEDRPSTEAATTTTSTVPDAPVTGPAGRVLRRAAGAGEASFRATYSVLRKLGGAGAVPVAVTAAPGSARLEVADLVVVTGPEPATCRVSASRCVGEVREEQLAPYGAFAGFWSTGPAAALRALVARDDAGEPQRSARTLAGQALECVAVPVGAGVPNTSCVTASGVFGYVDTPSVRIELTEYLADPGLGEQEVPFPLTDDDGFLTRGGR